MVRAGPSWSGGAARVLLDGESCLALAGGRLGLRGGRAWRVLGWALTFVAVVVAWVFFRANSFDAALAMLGAMAGANGVAVPPDWLNARCTGG